MLLKYRFLNVVLNLSFKDFRPSKKYLENIIWCLYSLIISEHLDIETNTNKSFLAAGSDGLLALYEKSDSKEAKNIFMRSDRKFNLN